MPALHRWVGNPLLSFIGPIFFKAELGDFHCGLRGFNTSAIRNLPGPVYITPNISLDIHTFLVSASYRRILVTEGVRRQRFKLAI